MTDDGEKAATFHSQIAFHNRFSGTLPAAEYPKVGFYFALSLVYTLMGGVWLTLCLRHRQE